MRTFLKRLAILLTVPPAALAIASLYFNASKPNPDYFAAGLLAVWCAFVWAIYWVVIPLTAPATKHDSD